jgi:hypothetical protein
VRPRTDFRTLFPETLPLQLSTVDASSREAGSGIEMFALIVFSETPPPFNCSGPVAALQEKSCWQTRKTGRMVYSSAAKYKCNRRQSLQAYWLVGLTCSRGYLALGPLAFCLSTPSLRPHDHKQQADDYHHTHSPPLSFAPYQLPPTHLRSILTYFSPHSLSYRTPLISNTPPKTPL